MKLMFRTAPLVLVLLLGSAGYASAQSLSAFFGVGTATDSANGQSYDFVNGGAGPFFAAPKMTGTFGVFGANFMFFKHLGVGGEYSFKFSQGDYAQLGYRPTFYDFNAIYEPWTGSKTFVPELQGGIGGATVHLYVNQAYCVVSCQNFSTPVTNDNHFQLHGAAALRIYVKGNIFIRPAVDLHFMTSYPEFGSKLVPQYTVSIGYSFGER